MDNIQHNLVTGHPRECMLSCFHHVHLFATPWTVAHKALLSIGFSRQEYWSGLPFPSPGGLPDPGIEPRSPTLQADALTSEPPGKSLINVRTLINLLKDSQLKNKKTCTDTSQKVIQVANKHIKNEVQHH